MVKSLAKIEHLREVALRAEVIKALKATQYNVTQAAKTLDMAASTLRDLIRKLDLDLPLRGPGRPKAA